MRKQYAPVQHGAQLLLKHGGYRQLFTYKKAVVIFNATTVFAHRFLSAGDRTVDQMIQAARSGKQNIIEGSNASGISKKTELKLTGVARASLDELLEDYYDYLADMQTEQPQAPVAAHTEQPQAQADLQALPAPAERAFVREPRATLGNIPQSHSSHSSHSSHVYYSAQPQPPVSEKQPQPPVSEKQPQADMQTAQPPVREKAAAAAEYTTN